MKRLEPAGGEDVVDAKLSLGEVEVEAAGAQEGGSKSCGVCSCLTTRQKYCCYSIGTLLLALASFYVVRVVQLFQMVDTTARFDVFEVADLCDQNGIGVHLAGSLNNPGIGGISLQRGSVLISNSNGELLFTVETPPFTIEAGQFGYDFELNIDICEDCISRFQSSVQDLLDKKSVAVKIELDMVADVDASVFLFPISVSLGSLVSPIDFNVESPLAESTGSGTGQVSDEESCNGDFSKLIQRLDISDGATVATLLSVLDVNTVLFPDCPQSSSSSSGRFQFDPVFNLSFPDFTFLTTLNGRQGPVISTPSIIIAQGSRETLPVTVLLTDGLVEPIRTGLVEVFETSSMVLGFSTPAAASNETCLVKRAFGGVSFSQAVDFTESEEDTDETSSAGNSTRVLSGLDPLFLDSWDDTVIAFSATASLSLLSFAGETRLSIPSVLLNFTKVVSLVESELLTLDLAAVTEGTELNATAEFNIASYEELVRTFADFGAVDGLFVQGSSDTIISRLIPRIEIPVGGNGRRLQASSQAETSLVFDVSVSSNATTVAVRTAVDVLQDFLPVTFGFRETSIAVSFEGQQMASIFIPATTIGDQGSGTGDDAISFEMFGSGGTLWVDRLLDSSFDLSLSFNGQTGGGPFSFTLPIPSDLVEPMQFVYNFPRTGSNFGSSRRRILQEEDESSATLKEVMLLGGSAAGEDIVLPCLLDPYCTDILAPGRDENFTTTSLTLGLSFENQQPSGSAPFRMAVDFESELCIQLGLNGFDLMELSAGQRMSVDTSFPGSPVNIMPRVTILSGETTAFRQVLNDVVLPGNDLVVSFKGCNDGTYLSSLIAQVPTIDVELVGDGLGVRRLLAPRRALQNIDCFFCFPVIDDQNKVPLANVLPLSVQVLETQQKLLRLALGSDIFFAQNFSIPMGSVELGLLTGHDSGGLNGFEVATVTLQPNDLDGGGSASFALKSSGQAQTIDATMTVQYDTPSERLAMNSFISAAALSFFDAAVLPVEVVGRVDPPQNASKYDPKCASPGACSFNLQSWMTLRPPPRAEVNKSDTTTANSTSSNPLDKLVIDFFDTFCRMLGFCGSGPNFQLQLILRVVNSLDFDILFNAFKMKLLLRDPDGVDRDDAGFFDDPTGAVECLFDLNPASFSAELDPVSTINVIEGDGFFTLGNENLPFASPIRANSRSNATLAVDFNPSTDTAARMIDELVVKSSFCADLAEGRVILGLQDNRNCADNFIPSRTADQAECTFLFDIPFTVTRLPLLPVKENIASTFIGSALNLPRDDSCGGSFSSSAQEDPINPIGFESGYSSFTLVSGMSTFNRVLIDPGCSGDEGESHWRLVPISVADSFRLNFTSTVSQKCTLDAGEGYSVVFKIDQPSSDSEDFFDTGTSVREGYKGIDRSLGFSFFHATGRCNEFRVLKNGKLESESEDALLARSQALLGSRIIGSGNPVSILYDSLLKRVQVQFQSRLAEFDLDIPFELDGATRAYVGIVATSRFAEGSTMTFSGVTLETASTDSSMTSLAPPRTIDLFKAGEYGDLFVVTKDPEGRPRGTGGNLLKVKIFDAETGAPADITRDDAYITSLLNDDPNWYCAESASSPNVFNACVFDNDDGTYRVHYRINVRGRYRVTVECEPASPDCLGTTPAEVTNALFVRA